MTQSSFRVKDFHHASLLVADTGRAMSFYVDILGLDVLPDRPALAFPGVWLSIGSRQIHLLELPNPDPVDARPEHGGRDRHLALVVDDLGALADTLAARGVEYTLSQSGRSALFCRDPDGNALEFMKG